MPLDFREEVTSELTSEGGIGVLQALKGTKGIPGVGNNMKTGTIYV